MGLSLKTQQAASAPKRLLRQTRRLYVNPSNVQVFSVSRQALTGYSHVVKGGALKLFLIDS